VPAVTAAAHLRGMICRECGERSSIRAAHVCEQCFGPLDVEYDRPAIAGALTRAAIESRPRNLWRYRELLPVAQVPEIGLHSGWTPLVRADRLARALGLAEVWVKNEAVSHPSLSFKDRVVSTALAQARALGITTVACASTGNLANALAALAVPLGMTVVVLVPAHLEPAKLLGTTIFGAQVIAVRGSYDEANRLASELADERGWGFVNVNLKPFYAEGSKTVGHEISEQLGWQLPAHVIVPMAGGSLLHKLHQGLQEMAELGLVPARACRVHGAQPAGCAPIARMIREGRDEPVLVKEPRTIASSLAIGNPGDAAYARAAILASGGFAAAPDDEEILDGVRLLAQTTGIFGEPAGGVVVAAARQLLREGRIGPGDGPVVLCLTGPGLKTPEALAGRLPPIPEIAPRRADFEALWRARADHAADRGSALD
jgi:threonine synthase